MTAKEFREFIEKQNFRNAVTARRNPHAYIVRSKSVNGTDADFDAAAEFINKYGFKITFWGVEYTVFHMGSHFYWVIDDILNRNNLCDYVVTITPRY